MIIVGRELNHHATLRRLIYLGYRKNAAVIQSADDSAELPDLGTVDEQDLAILDFIDAAETPNDQGVLRDALTAHGFFQAGPERIVPQDPDHEWLVGCRECLSRPIDKVREIEDEHRLHLIFGGQLRGRGRLQEKRNGERTA
jgi:hypothetical protein